MTTDMTGDASIPARAIVGLVQINNSFFNQNYFPYSIGFLKAYADKYQAGPYRFHFLPMIYKRIPIEESVERLLPADIVGFSTYVWNMKISLAIAERLKKRNPAVVIVFGGPQVPNSAEPFLREFPFVDIACHGEGEKLFLSVLEQFSDRNWGEVPSVSYIDAQGTFIRTGRCMRIEDIEGIPSPYLEGVFENLIADNPDEEWLALWETNRGCPFSCAYCDWGSATQSRLYAYDIGRLRKEVDWFRDHRIEFIYCCDSNFGILSRDMDIVRQVARSKAEFGYPKVFSVQNTKNSTDRTYHIQKALADAGLNKGVTLSLQSTNPETLKSIRRQNISLMSFQELQQLFTRDGISTYTDMILGLPKETYETYTRGIAEVIEKGQHNRIQFGNLIILPNSEMGDFEYQKEHGFVIRESKVVNIHGSYLETDGVYETQKIVVATNTMPEDDWVKARVFSWMAAFLHFDKALQIPFLVLNKTCGLPFREMIGLFAEEGVRSPVLASIRDFLTEKALDLQNGGPEYSESKEWLNIWWPPDELLLIKLCAEDQLGAFYQEAEEALAGLIEKKQLEFPRELLSDAMKLNRDLIKLPFQSSDAVVSLRANLWEIYQGAVQGVPASLEKGYCLYRIDRTVKSWSSWDVWCKEVIWYGNKTGAYLYNCSREV